MAGRDRFSSSGFSPDRAKLPGATFTLSRTKMAARAFCICAGRWERVSTEVICPCRLPNSLRSTRSRNVVYACNGGSAKVAIGNFARVEEYHKSLKSNASFSKSPTHTIRSQSNHFFASVIAYVKLEVCRHAIRLNHFAQKARLYQAAIASAFEQLQSVKASVPLSLIDPPLIL